MFLVREKWLYCFLLFGAFSLGGLVGCAKGRDCPSLAADQKSSLMASPPQFPVTIVVDLRWDAQERVAIEQAARTWNEMASASGSPPFFEIRTGSVQDLTSLKEIDACKLPQGSDSEFVLARIEGVEIWASMGFSHTTPAVTVRCQRGDDARKQAILVNADLITSEQLQSVFLHELGHSLGLDHSCQLGQGTASFRSCEGLLSNHPYRKAVMYPSLWIAPPTEKQGLWGHTAYRPSPLEIKELLESNDVERASCLLNR
jgi:hypothetical protein